MAQGELRICICVSSYLGGDIGNKIINYFFFFLVSVGSGHYTAYATHEGRWYHFNDSTVTVTEEETVGKAKAYILFYVERPVPATPEKL